MHRWGDVQKYGRGYTMGMSKAETKLVKNISEGTLALAGIGEVAAGATIEVPVDFNNANFEVVTKAPKKETPKDTSND